MCILSWNDDPNDGISIGGAVVGAEEEKTLWQQTKQAKKVTDDSNSLSFLYNGLGFMRPRKGPLRKTTETGEGHDTEVQRRDFSREILKAEAI